MHPVQICCSRRWCTSWSWPGTLWRSCSWTVPRGGSSCPTSLTGFLFISMPVGSEPGMSAQAVTCICEVIFLQVSSVTGRRQPGAAWGLLGGGHSVCPPGSRWLGQKSPRLHSEFTMDPFTSLDELLRKMPLCSAISSATQFEFSWLAWQVEVSPKSLIEKAFVEHWTIPVQGDLVTAGGGLRSLPELTTVAQLLAGQEEALHLVAERCETWYGWLVAGLLYTLWARGTRCSGSRQIWRPLQYDHPGLCSVGAPGSRHSTGGEGALSQPGQLLVLCSLARPATSCGRSRAG